MNNSFSISLLSIAITIASQTIIACEDSQPGLLPSSALNTDCSITSSPVVLLSPISMPRGRSKSTIIPPTSSHTTTVEELIRNGRFFTQYPTESVQSSVLTTRTYALQESRSHEDNTTQSLLFILSFAKTNTISIEPHALQILKQQALRDKANAEQLLKALTIEENKTK